MKYKYEDRSGIIWIMWFIGVVGSALGCVIYERAKNINDVPLNFILQLFTTLLPMFLMAWSSFSLINYYARIKGEIGDYLEIFDDRIIVPNTDSIFIPFLKKVNEIQINKVKHLEADTIGVVGVARIKIYTENHQNIVVTSKNLGDKNFDKLLSYFKDKFGTDLFRSIS